ncbi:hypothetical protein BKH15_01315 [Actinomyces oris]|uniref:Uncharacterized protein n=1 Tax=Actinomyces oris TaxID=544580 RepID=A0A1Q8XHC1_9ACTO|nr:hypothetical protein BKH15_01315 [Actinomyces oris]
MPPSITETTPAVRDPLLDKSTEGVLKAMMCITSWPSVLPGQLAGPAWFSCAARRRGAWRRA